MAERRIKVRFKDWYWGNYCMAPENAVLPIGFEPYDEEKHGWHNSEEFKVYGKKQYQDPDEHACNIETVINTTYIKRRQDQIKLNLIVTSL